MELSKSNRSCAPSDLVVIAKVGAPYGVKGWSHVQSFTEVTDDVIKYSNWLIEKKAVWVDGRLEQVRRHGTGVVAKFKEANDRDKAATLTGLKIAVARTEFAQLPADQFYWRDLVGLSVLAAETSIGTVQYLYEAGANDIMVVQEKDKEHHIPFTYGDVVQKVCLKSKEIVLDWEVIT